MSPPPAPAGPLGALDEAEAAELRELTRRPLRLLNEEELASVEALARWAIYRSDDGVLPEFCGSDCGCCCDGPVCENIRPDVTEETLAWLADKQKAAADLIEWRLDAEERWRLRDEAHDRAMREIAWRNALSCWALVRCRWVAPRPAVRPRGRRSRRAVAGARAGPARPREDDPEPPLDAPAGAAA